MKNREWHKIEGFDFKDILFEVQKRIYPTDNIRIVTGFFSLP